MYTKSKTVEKALEIIEYIVGKNSPTGIHEIAKSININTSTVQRIINTLNSTKYLCQDPESKKYSLGLKFLEISKVILDEMDVWKIAHTYLKELRDTTQETIHLMILDHYMGVYIDSLESPQMSRVASAIGTRADLHYSAVGKAILAHLPDDEVEKVVKTIGLKKMTQNTITDFKELKKELLEIRNRGYSIDNEEGEIGTCCIGVPILKHNGKVIASISLAAPSHRLTKKKVEEYMPLIVETAKKISADLGYIK